MTTSKYYIEAYTADDRPILGNLAGQDIIYSSNYKRSPAYKKLLDGIGGPSARVAYWLIVASHVTAYSGKYLERVDNSRYRTTEQAQEQAPEGSGELTNG